MAAAGAVDGGRLQQPPAVEHRLRVDPRGAAAGGADREAHAAAARARAALPARPSTVPAVTRAPRRSRPRGAGLCRPARPRPALSWLARRRPRRAAGPGGRRGAPSACATAAPAGRAWRRGRAPAPAPARVAARGGLRPRGAGSGPARRGVVAAARPAPERACGAPRGSAWPRRRAARTCRCCRGRPAGRRSGRAATSGRCRTMRPSLTATTGARARVTSVTARRPSLATGRAGVGAAAGGERAAGQPAAVGRAPGDGEAALREPGQRAHEVGREAADEARAHASRTRRTSPRGCRRRSRAAGRCRRPPRAGSGRRRRSRRRGCRGRAGRRGCRPRRSAAQLDGMNCIQPSAPAEEMFRLRP